MASAVGEGSRSDAEAWRNEANELKEAPAALGLDFRECVLSILHSISKVGLETQNLIHDNDNHEEINNICNSYWVAAYPDVVSNFDEDEEAAPPGGAAPTIRRVSDLDEDLDDDLPIGRLRAGGGANAGSGATA